MPPGLADEKRATFGLPAESPTDEADDHDALPQVPDLSNWVPPDAQAIDLKKWELYDLLKKFYRFIRSIKNYPPEERLSAQQRVEERFVQVLHLFRSKIGIQQIYSHDDTGTRIRTHNPTQIQRQVSRTTRIYTGDPISDAPELEQGCPFISYPKNWRLPPRLTRDLQVFYHGQYKDGGRTITDYPNFECSAFHRDDLVYVCFDNQSNSHHLMLGDMDVQTGFFSRATAIAIDPDADRLWIAGDVRVRSFTLASLHPDDTLYVRRDVVRSSCLAIWQDYVVLGTQNTLLAWTKTRDQSRANPPRGDLRTKQYDEFVSRFRLGPETIDWTRGRPNERQLQFQNELKEITSVCAVGNYLAVASRAYPAIHLFALASGGQIVQRLVGHTMGITCLLAHREDQLFSGSADKTIKLWNLENGTVEFSFERHGGAISALEVRDYKTGTFLFTGGEDHIIHAWDINRKKPMFQLDVGQAFYPTGMYFDPDEKQLGIVNLPVTDHELDEFEQTQQTAQLQVFSFTKCDDDK
jgi:hypothetical protein